jgi:hypothetical protein
MALLSTLALVPAGLAVAAPASNEIGHGVQLKGTRVWYAHGKAVAPKTLAARVVPVPEQPVKVQWSVVCQKPNRSDPAVHLGTSVESGHASVHAAATVQLALPYVKPPACVATVYATLAKNGRLLLRLLQT